MFCWNCGKEMEDDLLHCPHCGMKQAGIPEPEKKRRLPVFGILCIVFSVILLAGLIGMLLGTSPAQPEKEVDPYSVALPDLASFLNTQYTWEDDSAYTHYATCVVKKVPGEQAVGEYIKLLQEKQYQMILDDSWAYAEKDVEYQDYIFRYSGKNEDIRWVPHKEGYRYHVKLSVYHRPDKDTMTITLYTAPGFLLEDPGVDAKALQ